MTLKYFYCTVASAFVVSSCLLAQNVSSTAIKSLAPEAKVAVKSESSGIIAADDSTLMVINTVRKYAGNRGNVDKSIFSSMDLSDDQRSQIEGAVNAREDARRNLILKARKARETGDSSYRRNPNFGAELQLKYIHDIQKILSKEQYIQFLESSYVLNSIWPRISGEPGQEGKYVSDPRLKLKHVSPSTGVRVENNFNSSKSQNSNSGK